MKLNAPFYKKIWLWFLIESLTMLKEKIVISGSLGLLHTLNVHMLSADVIKWNNDVAFTSLFLFIHIKFIQISSAEFPYKNI